MNYSISTSELIAKAARQNLADADKSKTFEYFREYAKSIRKAYMDMYEDAQADIYANYKTFSESVARAKNDEIEKALNKHVPTIKDNLNTMLDALVKEKNEALNNYISATPSTDMVNILNALTLRGKDIPAEELEILAEKFATNYQASATFNAIVSEMGYTFTSPVKIYETRENIEKAEQLCRRAINGIDNTDFNYSNEEFYSTSAGDAGSSATILGAADNDPSLVIEAEKPTLRKRLENEIVNAKASGDSEKATKLSFLASKYNATTEGQAERNAAQLSEVENAFNELTGK